MSERSCAETRRRLALGEEPSAAGLTEHLAECASCRGEAERFARLLGRLAEGAEVDPGHPLDRRVLQLISGPPSRPRWALNPAIATALAAGSLLALLSAAASALAQGGGSGAGLAPALVAVTSRSASRRRCPC
jgi:predicted anti-sigma-YlaC factor YlaD